jgi:hypothetical protein
MILNEKRVCNSLQLARVGDTTIYLLSEERFANSSDSKQNKDFETT